ncbi:DUF455 family protein [Luteolibacter ambystomatis]|uniref:DUF455 family protein n=1 Tax=Luteolibacter ambystomatis TaxID=2824561 RepID=A0A975G6Y4_9BACT|nr:DUF455 family protein [Luteolibacter ambystomatis]QUE49928.1 DUF455 family protein [Luteolibacter ambystomatis]
MQMREAAERVLFASTLEEKLLLVPKDIRDDQPGKAIAVPGSGPGRPAELRLGEKGVKVDFPGTHRLDDDRERGRLLHFLANHELLAAELMALVLLKFPDAPKEYRAGVYEAMREEQMHTLLYLRRMRECGIGFGELPLNDFFWKLVAPVESPLEFVTRLNLTFEQANLDFSKHYAALFRQAGDNATAAVLEKIYQDEIGHVGHGVKWFRHWKQHGTTDWEAFCQVQRLPLSAARAKGVAPFNAEGRRLAGLDEDFIRHLEVYGQSRGRTPVLAWFNPDAESHVMAAVSGTRYDPNKHAVALDEDLEILALAWCRKDDIAVMRRPPSAAHLASLKAAGLEIPEIVSRGDLSTLQDRKLGGMRPWAWSPDASALFEGLADNIAPSMPWAWRESLPPVCFSKELGVRLEEQLGISSGQRGRLATDLDIVRERAAVIHAGDRSALLKAAYSCAGRGHFRIDPGRLDEAAFAWIRQALEKHRAIAIEPWLRRVLDFSALYEMEADGRVRLVGMTVMENDSAGRFTGTRVAWKWGSMLDPECAAFFFGAGQGMDWYENRIPAELPALLPGHVGPVGIDAMIHRLADGSLALRPVVEVNVRMTMGRIALELQKRKAFRGNGRFRILRKKTFDGMIPGRTLLTDPSMAKEFIAVWDKQVP